MLILKVNLHLKGMFFIGPCVGKFKDSNWHSTQKMEEVQDPDKQTI